MIHRVSAAFEFKGTPDADAVGKWTPGAVEVEGNTVHVRMSVDDLAAGSKKWYALTTAGLLVSDDQGGAWRSGLLPRVKDLVGISVASPAVIAATRREVMVSLDAGATWYTCTHIDSASLINGSISAG